MTRSKPLKSSFWGRHRLKFLLPGLLFIGTVLLILLVSFIPWHDLFLPLQDIVFSLEATYKQWLITQNTSNPIFLLLFAFIGGLIGSISPCHLGLLTVNLTYIGTREFTSYKDAVLKAGAFVLGVVTVLSVLGLFAAFAGTVTVRYSGYFSIAVGSIILLMGLTLLGIVRLSLPQLGVALPITGPYSAGLTFALVSSPCNSPVLIAILSAAAATGSQFHSVLTMVSYALGTTVIIFLASLFTGLAKQTRTLLNYSEWIVRIGGGLLIVMGGFYLVNGIRWVFLMLQNL